MPPDWTRLAGLAGDDFQLALLAEADAVMDGQPDPEEDRLLPALPEPRIGANRMADIVSEAPASYVRASAEWAARRADIDAAGEFAVVKPYQGLPNADHLVRLTRQYWQAAADDDWGSKLDIYLREQVRLLTE